MLIIPYNLCNLGLPYGSTIYSIHILSYAEHTEREDFMMYSIRVNEVKESGNSMEIVLLI